MTQPQRLYEIHIPYGIHGVKNDLAKHCISPFIYGDSEDCTIQVYGEQDRDRILDVLKAEGNEGVTVA